MPPTLSRRDFVKAVTIPALATLPGCKLSFEQGLRNPCKTPIAWDKVTDDIVRRAFAGIDAAQVWDAHAHLFGQGDSDSGIVLHPDMAAPTGVHSRLQRSFYLNAGCVVDKPGERDASMLARLMALLDALPTGYKMLLFGFDYFYDESGKTVPDRSTFYVPNAYAERVAKARPNRLEWVASVHPYRADALDALDQVAAAGARAIKWLPAAQGMNPGLARCDAYFKKLAALKLPLISHAGEEQAVKGGDTQSFGNPLHLRRAMEQGVRVVVAHCASLGEDVDLDRGANGERVASFELFARMMDQSQWRTTLFADISAVVQSNRVHVLPQLIARPDWHGRLLHGSDYPLPGVFPLVSLNKFVEMGLLDAAEVPAIRRLREHNVLLAEFVLKRSLRSQGKGFEPQAFHTRRFFDPGFA